MSFRAMLWAWEVDGLTLTTKMVLLSLAQHANDQGANSWPSVKKIAGECRMSERSVQGALKALESEGYISIHRRLRQTSVFVMRMDLQVSAKRGMPQPIEGAESAPIPHPADSAPSFDPANTAGRVVQILQFNPADSAPEPVHEPIHEPADARAKIFQAEEFTGGLFGDEETTPDSEPPFDPYNPHVPPKSSDPAVYYRCPDLDIWRNQDEWFHRDLKRWHQNREARARCVERGETGLPELGPMPQRPEVPWVERRRLPGQEAQQPAPPGWKLPFNRDPMLTNYAPIPPEPGGDPKQWMPRLSHPEHKWAILAPGVEIDSKSMNGGRLQCRGGWRLSGLAKMVAEACGWNDWTRYVDWRPLCAWLDDGICPHDTILPAIKRVMARKPGLDVVSLAYFDNAVRQPADGYRRTG